MKRTELTLVRGIVAGFIAATVLALWFLVIDSIEGHAFHTPAFLASILAHVNGVERSTGLIAMYTALHYAAFFVVGIVMAWLTNRLQTAPPILLGLVLGFLLFDLVFYFGVAYTGVNVVNQLGWPEVLVGNLLAGLSLMGYLNLVSERPTVTWWQALAEHQIVREGIMAGVIGAVAVAIWFLLFDIVRGRIFFTPGALGSAFFLRVSDLGDVQINVLTVAGYTLVHFAAFIAAGLVAAAIVVQAEKAPPVILAAILVFAAFEAFFVGLLAIVAEWLLGALAYWTIAGGNLLATVGMAYYLWRKHPRLRESLRQDPFAPKGWPPEEETKRPEANASAR